MASAKSSSVAATEGIWYYVYFRPDWQRLFVLNGHASHFEYWKKTVVPMLMNWYKLDAKKRMGLSELPTSMPRGSVILDQGRYGTYHGDDFPKGLTQEAEIKKIVSGFGCPGIYLSSVST